MPWFNNQYWDEKKHRWKTVKGRPVGSRGLWTWLGVLALIAIGFVVVIKFYPDALQRVTWFWVW